MLLIIDMQEDFFRHERLVNHRAALTRSVNALADLCRAHGVPVVWVTQVLAPDLSDAPLAIRARGLRVVVSGTPGAAILEELTTSPDDVFIIKKRYSAFFGTTLDATLAQLGAGRLIVAGVNTHACVRTTVVDAYQRDYEVVLASEGIDSYDAEHHEVTWRYLVGTLAKGCTNEQIRSLLAADADRVDPPLV